MSIQMWQEIKALKARVEKLEAKEAMRVVVSNNAIVKQEMIKKLCPHCQEKPAYHFHVKNCPKNKNNNGANQGTGGS